MQVVLPGQRAKIIEVVWFTRIQDRCFHIGARFAEQAQGLSSDDGEAAARPDPLRSSDGSETKA